MNTKTIILIGVLLAIAGALYYFVAKKPAEAVVVDAKTTSETTGLSSLLNTTGGSALLKLFAM